MEILVALFPLQVKETQVQKFLRRRRKLRTRVLKTFRVRTSGTVGSRGTSMAQGSFSWLG